MATKSMRYDHPTYTVRQVAPIKLPATAASTTVSKFVAFTDIKVKSINAMVQIAGTTGSAGYDILNGTTSVGAITVGTTAAATMLSAVTTDITLASGGYIDFKTKAASATGAAEAYVEFEIIPGAAVTA
jgi:hypothetical protein